jgi:hypothetical protein
MRQLGLGKVVAVMYGAVMGMIGEILKEEVGVGFTRGMGPRVLHSACFLALSYFAFETARMWLLFLVVVEFGKWIHFRYNFDY